MLRNGYLSVLIAACLVASFLSADAQCPSSQPLTLDVNGTFESPGFPVNYSNNGYCSWLLRAASGMVIRLTFNNFSTQACCDHVSIRDGRDTYSRTITYLSGINVDINDMRFSSTQQYMYISFNTDDSVVSTGFSATFESIPYEQCPPSSLPQNWYGSGTLNSPYYPARYHNSSDCNWRLEAYYGMIVTFTINFMSTAVSNDVVYIYDGYNSSSRMIVGTSGNIINPTTFSSTQQYMYIRFAAKTSNSYQGFTATFQSKLNTGSVSSSTTTTTTTIDSSQCPSSSQPQNFYGSGSLQSPNSPYNYPNNVDCNWRLSSSYGVVHLTFSYFSTEQSSDYLTLYDGYTDFYPQIATLSGSSVLTSGYYSTQQYMYIRFVTDSSVTASGFQAYFASSTYQPVYNSDLDWWEIVLIVIGCVAGAAICLFTIIAVCRHYQRRKKADVKTANAGNPTAAGGINNAAHVDGSTCVACKDRPSDKVVLIPCGHCQFCSGCIQTMMTSGGFCPICRQNVQLVLPLYS